MPVPADRVDVCEVRNLATVGAALVAAAAAREESRGCHTRTDFPETVPALARRFVIS
jgi:L-aspartate oxidase